MTPFLHLLQVTFLSALPALADPPSLSSCTAGNLSSIVAHDGSPTGQNISVGGHDMYLTGNQSSTAVIYLTDVFGLALPQNKLLADSFARAGFLVLAPDLFDRAPAPTDVMAGGGSAPGFNSTEFLRRHDTNATDPIVQAAIEYARREKGAKRVAVTGYCFGGRYAMRALGYGDGDRRANVGFAAHPSGITSEDVLGMKGPMSVAAAENDPTMAPDRRAEVEALLRNSTMEYQVVLYAGTVHGFGVRANLSSPRSKWGKEAAFGQAVGWFNAWG